MSFGPQRPGGVFTEAEPERISLDAPTAVESYETAHLCLKCIHASVCALPAAIRTLGAEGQIVISKCAAFFSVDDVEKSGSSPSS